LVARSLGHEVEGQSKGVIELESEFAAYDGFLIDDFLEAFDYRFCKDSYEHFVHHIYQCVNPRFGRCSSNLLPQAASTLLIHVIKVGFHVRKVILSHRRNDFR
jgi:hypothetical protein